MNHLMSKLDDVLGVFGLKVEPVGRQVVVEVASRIEARPQIT